MKKPLPLLLSICLLLTACGQAAPEPESGRLKIVTTVFPAYDFARAAAGGLADVELLLPPGTESHSYEPTPADILAVQDCDLFIYLGGESDTWVETTLSVAVFLLIMAVFVVMADLGLHSLYQFFLQ